MYEDRILRDGNVHVPCRVCAARHKLRSHSLLHVHHGCDDRP